MPEAEEALKEKARNVDIGIGLIGKNARDFLLVWATEDSQFYYVTNNRTWAMGAARRAQVSLDEREIIDTHRHMEDD